MEAALTVLFACAVFVGRMGMCIGRGRSRGARFAHLAERVLRLALSSNVAAPVQEDLASVASGACAT